MIKFNGENILVTGASDGIGKATCILLNELGANVIGIARSEEKLVQIKEEVVDKNRFHYICRDLSIGLDELPKMVMSIAKNFGKLDGLVCCAGKVDIIPLKGVTSKNINNVFDLNFKSLLLITKGFADKRVSFDGASIVYISSINSLIGSKGIVGYASSKGAINSLVKALALETSNRKIKINGVLPSYIATDVMLGSQDLYNENFIDDTKSLHPLGSGETQDVATLILLLLSSASRLITGQSIAIDGVRSFL